MSETTTLVATIVQFMLATVIGIATVNHLRGWPDLRAAIHAHGILRGPAQMWAAGTMVAEFAVFALLSVGVFLGRPTAGLGAAAALLFVFAFYSGAAIRSGAVGSCACGLVDGELGRGTVVRALTLAVVAVATLVLRETGSDGPLDLFLSQWPLLVVAGLSFGLIAATVGLGGAATPNRSGGSHNVV